MPYNDQQNNPFWVGYHEGDVPSIKRFKEPPNYPAVGTVNLLIQEIEPSITISQRDFVVKELERRGILETMWNNDHFKQQVKEVIDEFLSQSIKTAYLWQKNKK